jgi:hypothetical protein
MDSTYCLYNIFITFFKLYPNIYQLMVCGTPSIAACDMKIYEGDKFYQWNGLAVAKMKIFS